MSKDTLTNEFQNRFYRVEKCGAQDNHKNNNNNNLQMDNLSFCHLGIYVLNVLEKNRFLSAKG